MSRAHVEGCKMKIHNDKVLSTDFESILPFSAAWWSSWTKPERDDPVPTTATWLADSVELSPFSARCPRVQEAIEGAHDAVDVRGGEVHQDYMHS